jgi:hypothetical protein
LFPNGVIIRWADGDCKIWHYDGDGPGGLGWQPVAFANSYPEAKVKLEAILSLTRL